MVYGIVSAKDVQSNFEYLKSKKVSQRNLVTADRLKQLIEVLSAGNVVHVISVDRFPSVNAFVTFAGMVFHKEASMKILDQSYLDIGNGKYYKPNVWKHLNELVRLEGVNVNRLLKSLQLTDAEKEYVIRCVTDVSIGILVKTYASDGILHRGS